MEELFKKDIIKEVNPYLFSKIQNKILEEKSIYSKRTNLALRYGLVVLGGIILMNIFMIFSPKQEKYDNNIAYQRFVQENYFDVLANSFNDKIIFPEEK